jgi:hypothetical protein
VVILLLGLGAAAWFGLPLLTGPDREQADAGTVKASVVTEAPQDAGVAVAQPGDPATSPTDQPAEEPALAADAEKKVAVVKPPKPPKPRLPPAIKLTHQEINQTLRRYGDRLQNCADTHLTQESSGQDVSLKLDFTIASTGRVTRVGLNPGSLESSKFGRCLISRVKRIKFPRHVDKSVSISFPLKFRVVKQK